MCRWRRSQLGFLGVLLGTMSRHQGLASPAPAGPRRFMAMRERYTLLPLRGTASRRTNLRRSLA